MRPGSWNRVLTALAVVFATTSLSAVDVPFYVNMGGPEVTDSLGRTWLGDEGVNTDANDIRPDDLGGGNVIPVWCNPALDAVAALGFDPGNANDVALFRSIRWDNAADAAPYAFAIPLEPGLYNVEFYFCESCCPQRHFKIDIEGELRFPDVHVGAYAGGVNNAPGRLRAVGVEVGDDGILDLALLPCPDPECPGGTDGNPVLSALAVLPFVEVCEFPCPSGLTLESDGAGNVTGSFTPPEDNPICPEIVGYQIYQNDVLVAELGPAESSFGVTQSSRAADYRVVTVLGDDDPPCPDLRATLVRPEIPFTVPVRINLGGPSAVDSRGRRWTGDPGANADTLDIRPVDLGGLNAITNWCTAVNAGNESFAALGLDAGAAGDQLVFNSIRWDVGDDDGDGFVGEIDDLDGGDTDYRLEIPIANGSYLVNLYFTECCCPNRHFQIWAEDVLVDDDVSSADSNRRGLVGFTERKSFEVDVADDFLSIYLPPCTVCIAPPFDGNAICDAVEVLEVGTPNPICPRDLISSVGEDGIVVLDWLPPEDLTVDGYAIYRDGELLEEIAGDLREYRDEPLCQRVTLYEVVPISDDPEFLCPDLVLRTVVAQPECPFGADGYINMGGPAVVDSLGRAWLGDEGAGLDPNNIRPDDIGGSNVITDWCNPAPDSIAALGLDPLVPSDSVPFRSIRWDSGADAIDYLLEIPVAPGLYEVSLYFCEQCCPQRHFSLELEDELVEPDIHQALYSANTHEAGRLTYGDTEGSEIVVADGFLSVRLLPCLDPECPGGTDANAILSALEFHLLETIVVNIAPNAVAIADPGNEVTLSGGSAQVTLDASSSDDGGDGPQALSFSWEKISGPDGDTIVTPGFPLTDVTFTQEGEYVYRVTVDDGGDVNATDSAEITITVSAPVGARFVRADANSNGTIELTDGIVTLGFLFLGATPPSCRDAADANDDGLLNLTDAVFTFGWLFSGGPAPGAPTPSSTNYLVEDCDVDPSDDALGCETLAQKCS